MTQLARFRRPDARNSPFFGSPVASRKKIRPLLDGISLEFGSLRHFSHTHNTFLAKSEALRACEAVKYLCSQRFWRRLVNAGQAGMRRFSQAWQSFVILSPCGKA